MLALMLLYTGTFMDDYSGLPPSKPKTVLDRVAITVHAFSRVRHRRRLDRRATSFSRFGAGCTHSVVARGAGKKCRRSSARIFTE
jgi:hypothetical protein